MRGSRTSVGAFQIQPTFPFFAGKTESSGIGLVPSRQIAEVTVVS